MPSASVTIHLEDDAVRFVNDSAVVEVSTAAHGFDVSASDGTRLRIGAIRTGARLVTTTLDAKFGHGNVEAIRSQIFDALLGGVRRSASRVARRTTDVERLVESIEATPLLFSLPFLTARHLRDDVSKFRACQVAVAHVEELFTYRDPTPDLVEEVVGCLGNWRALFCHPDSTKSAVNKTLGQCGERTSTWALWGLRNVPMTKRATSVVRLEVLGGLGAHPNAVHLRPLMSLVSDASDDELSAAMRAVAVHVASMLPASLSSAHVLAEVLATVGGDVPSSLAHATQAGIVAMSPSTAAVTTRTASRAPAGGASRTTTAPRTGSSRTATSRTATTTRVETTPVVFPPIPLPSGLGLRFLATVEDIISEGFAMTHCVATRASEARAGRAFLFHATDGTYDVTAQVDHGGRAVEVRGPGNTNNPLVATVRTALNGWGRGFWFADFDVDQRIWMPVRAVPKGTVALEKAGALFVAYEQMCALLGDDDGALSAWCARWAAAAARGDAWIVKRTTDESPALVVVNSRDRVVDHTDALVRQRRSARLPTSPRAVGF